MKKNSIKSVIFLVMAAISVMLQGANPKFGITSAVPAEPQAMNFAVTTDAIVRVDYNDWAEFVDAVKSGDIIKARKLLDTGALSVDVLKKIMPTMQISLDIHIEDIESNIRDLLLNTVQHIDDPNLQNVKNDLLDALIDFIKNGNRLGIRIPSLATFVLAAITTGSQTVFRALVDQLGANPNAFSLSWGGADKLIVATPLLMAITAGQLSMVKYLVEDHNIDPKAAIPQPDGRLVYPLDLAKALKKNDIITYLSQR